MRVRLGGGGRWRDDSAWRGRLQAGFCGNVTMHGGPDLRCAASAQDVQNFISSVARTLRYSGVMVRVDWVPLLART